MFYCEICGYCDMHCECEDGEESIVEDTSESFECPICEEEFEDYLDEEEVFDLEDELLGGD